MNLCEKMISDASMIYQMRGQGMVQKIDPPSRVIRSKGGLRTIYSGNGLPDFLGHWCGHALAIEAKYSSTHRRLYFDDKLVRRAQVRWLDKWTASGALGGFLMLFNYRVGKKRPPRILREAYFFQVDDKMSRWSRGGEKDFSRSIEWMRDNAIEVPEKDGGLAWGAAIEQLVR